MDKRTAKAIARRAATYNEKKEPMRAKEKEVQAAAFRNLGKEGEWNKHQLIEMISILGSVYISDFIPLHRLIDWLYSPEMEVKWEKEPPEELPLSDAAVVEMQGLVKEYARLHKEYDRAKKDLEAYVEGYMKKNDVKNSIEKLDELIECLPGSILRFRLIEIKILLEEKQKGNT